MFEINKPKIKIEYHSDALAISVARKRKESDLQLITREEMIYNDFVVADKIRNYYEQKLILLKLQGKSLSKYRMALENFLTSENKTKIDHDQEGLLYRLPEFYEYDIWMNNLFECNPSAESTDIGPFKKHINLNIRYLETRRKITRTKNLYEYWFKTDEFFVLYSVEKKNKLRNLFESLLRSGQSINTTGSIHSRILDSHTFYELTDIQSFVSV
jgi:hypothetical protein